MSAAIKIGNLFLLETLSSNHVTFSIIIDDLFRCKMSRASNDRRCAVYLHKFLNCNDPISLCLSCRYIQILYIDMFYL